MIITEKMYKRWLNFSYVVCSNRDIGADILQDVILGMLEKEMIDDRITDNYMFISIKNKYLNYLKKNKKKIEDDKHLNLYENDNDIEDTTSYNDLECLLEKNILDQKKLDILTDTILSLDCYEKKLYQLHFIWGYSQRFISRKIGVNHLTINNKINKIKIKIKENYEKRR